jgi:hypothetical protein
MLYRLEHEIGQLVVGLALLIALAFVGHSLKIWWQSVKEWLIGVRFRLSLSRRDWKAVVGHVKLVQTDAVKRRLEDLDAEVCVDVLPPGESSHGYKMGRKGGCTLIGWHLNVPQRVRWESRKVGGRSRA